MNTQQRVGTGFDAHRFVSIDDGQPMHLACIEDWPGPRIEGDSDGDIAVHALIDALLSASGLGDIGSMFGVGHNAKGAGMTGSSMLTEVRELLHEHHIEPINASICIIGNRPKFSPRRSEAQQRMSDILGCPVSITATTTDGMGFTGQGEGIAAIANCLVQLP
ncbi:2-C-methyl-D-erythritol 2,4-cyclodiphosphate synthase [Bifidobacterium dolichotidis]|uniref:2-C-methyl-D-erythritol 2,4-cyclodiphosphate synthase n=2 Tax=Bifidobacterium dolichotidis TaxID=2306976 RepID=A0A430FSQ2_9BIFI|nr:2-C-methyl-D-erythritol 2,4-cyclodiphosphate synthase [Bifidobacterium dolichotidis]